MSLFAAIIIGIGMGVVFGFLLEKSRVFEPGIIVGQMQFRSFVMLKVFLTAVATGAVVLAALNGFGLVKLHPKAALYAADVIGGLILGVGIVLAGACPGTALAQIGAGYRDAIFTVAGGLCGAVAYSYLEPWLRTTFLATGQGKLVFSDLVGIPYWAGALVLAAVLAAILALLERRRPWREEVGPNADGDLREGRAPAAGAVQAQPAE
jgi:hypothetical protein